MGRAARACAPCGAGAPSLRPRLRQRCLVPRGPGRSRHGRLGCAGSRRPPGLAAAGACSLESNSEAALCTRAVQTAPCSRRFPLKKPERTTRGQTVCEGRPQNLAALRPCRSATTINQPTNQPTPPAVQLGERKSWRQYVEKLEEPGDSRSLQVRRRAPLCPSPAACWALCSAQPRRRASRGLQARTLHAVRAAYP